jgi:hypothetical protein
VIPRAEVGQEGNYRPHPLIVLQEQHRSVRLQADVRLKPDAADADRNVRLKPDATDDC